MATIGFVGLGHMGQPMAINLLKAGHTLKVFDLSADAVQAVVKHGATAATSLADVAKGADVIFTMLQTGDQVEQVCCAEDNLFAHAAANTLFIDSSSINVEHSRKIHQIAKQAGFLMIDAPVSGGVVGAEAATLAIMVGGEDANFAKAQPYLTCLGKTIVHAGPAGNGQAAKICNNMILGISMIAVSEAFTLAEKLGLSPEAFFAISSKASGQCWSMTSYPPVPGLVDGVPSNNNYQPGFSAAMMLKDLNLSQAAAATADAATPLGALATSLYQEFVTHGNGELDFSGIIKKITGELD